jgi:hypothetical protein
MTKRIFFSFFHCYAKNASPYNFYLLDARRVIA